MQQRKHLMLKSKHLGHHLEAVSYTHLVDGSDIVLFYGSSYDEQGCFHTSIILAVYLQGIRFIAFHLHLLTIGYNIS